MFRQWDVHKVECMQSVHMCVYMRACVSVCLHVCMCVYVSMYITGQCVHGTSVNNVDEMRCAPDRVCRSVHGVCVCVLPPPQLIFPRLFLEQLGLSSQFSRVNTSE